MPRPFALVAKTENSSAWVGLGAICALFSGGGSSLWCLWTRRPHMVNSWLYVWDCFPSAVPHILSCTAYIIPTRYMCAGAWPQILEIWRYRYCREMTLNENLPCKAKRGAVQMGLCRRSLPNAKSQAGACARTVCAWLWACWKYTLNFHYSVKCRTGNCHIWNAKKQRQTLR